jgi:hypothetical protein
MKQWEAGFSYGPGNKHGEGPNFLCFSRNTIANERRVLKDTSGSDCVEEELKRDSPESWFIWLLLPKMKFNLG